jgi:hypothetical protein
MTNEQIAKFFAKRPKLKKAYVVDDKLIFLNEELAKERGGKVVVITPADGKPAASPSKGGGAPQGEEVEAAKAELLAFDLTVEKPDYSVMKRLVKVLGVETAGNKADDYVAALTTFKETLNEGGFN